MTGPVAATTLTAGVVVHAFTLDEPVDESVLAPDEVERGDRFRFARDRTRFRRRRARLRLILGAHLDRSPAELRFTRNAYGKPRVDGADVEFSATSSGELGAVAVATVPVGIDVERIDPRPDDPDVARRLFAAEEIAALADPADFFRCWSRKEAYVKAVGQGLSFPLASFAVEVAAVPLPRLLRSDLRPGDLTNCTIHDISDLHPGCAGALAVHAPGGSVMMRAETGFRSPTGDHR